MQLGIDLATGDASAADLPPIKVFWKDGNLFSLDNRRLFAGQMANVDLPCVMASPSDLTPAKMVKRFTTLNDGIGIVMRGVGFFSWFGS